MNHYPPPSYEAASYRQIWSIVAPFIPPEDLVSACLVCRKWHRSFAPQLWGNPAARFGADNDAVYFSLSRLWRLLPVARLEVRQLVHTLYFPPAESEFYEGPQAVWLRSFLDQLPAFQSLVASKFPFFDHRALQAVHQKYGETSTNTKTYGLRMLDASGCGNTTGHGLAAALQHFPALIYLDLSSTQGVRSPQVLSQFGFLNSLKILKLRRCGLRDEDAVHIRFPRSLLSLQLSDNLLSPVGISAIFLKLPKANYGPPSLALPRYSSASSQNNHFAGGVDKYARDILLSGIDGDVRIEEGLPSSFSQLFLTGNPITVESITKTLEHLSLDHLDCGSLGLDMNSQFSNVAIPRLPQINPVRFASSFGNLRSLRIHHSIITRYPFFGTQVISSEQIEQGLEGQTQKAGIKFLTHKLLRHQRTADGNRNPSRLKPSMLPNLKVLTLTDLPTRTRDAKSTSSLMLLIQECVEEEELSRLEYLSQFQHFDEPPKWELCLTHPIKLQRLVLEISSNIEEPNSPDGRRPSLNKYTKSSTEDADSEAFMQATEGDFSFFSDGDSDQLVREGRVTTPAFGYERSMLEARNEDAKWIEVVPAIVAFRKESKARFIATRRAENLGIEYVLSGHWIGDIKVTQAS